MDIVPSVAHYWQESPRDFFPLERELKTVIDLAKFIATPTHVPHLPADCKETNIAVRTLVNFKRLEQNSSLKEVAAEVYDEITSITAKLRLLEDLFLVLNDPVLVGFNILVDGITGSIMYIIDFDDAQIDALGMNIVTFFEWFVSNMENGHWSPYDMPAGEQYGDNNVCQVLEAAFWDTFWANTSPDSKNEGSKVVFR